MSLSDFSMMSLTLLSWREHANVNCVNILITSLEDNDDDVRAVAAAALAPVTEVLSNRLSTEELQRLMLTLWNCLSISPDGDELGSSTGAIMDLIGLLIKYSRIVSSTMPENTRSYIERTFAYVRHPISSVRLSVAQILYTFTMIPDFSRSEWMSADFFALLFQILVLEERGDIRDLAFVAFKAGLTAVGTVVDMIRFKAWYSLVMTPVGQPLEPRLFSWPSRMATGGHNVDKAMMAGDLGLVGMDVMLETRIAGAKALAYIRPFATVDEEEDGFDLISVDSHEGDAAADIPKVGRQVRVGPSLYADPRCQAACQIPTVRLGSSNHLQQHRHC